MRIAEGSQAGPRGGAAACDAEGFAERPAESPAESPAELVGCGTAKGGGTVDLATRWALLSSALLRVELVDIDGGGDLCGPLEIPLAFLYAIFKELLAEVADVLGPDKGSLRHEKALQCARELSRRLEPARVAR